jgi:hypothetical protein
VKHGTEGINTMAVKKLTIKEACEKHWDSHIYNCSGFAKAVAIELGVMDYFGLANDLIARMSKKPWKSLGKSETEANKFIKDGYFVVAGFKEEPNGHVVILTKTEKKYPIGYWGALKVGGKKNTTITQSFWPYQLQDVQYFAISIKK